MLYQSVAGPYFGHRIGRDGHTCHYPDHPHIACSGPPCQYHVPPYAGHHRGVGVVLTASETSARLSPGPSPHA